MKTQPKTLSIASALLALFIFNTPISSLPAQVPSRITYQGRLVNADGTPAAGVVDIQFALWDSPSAGTLLAGPLTNTAIGLSNGLFTAILDFGAFPFTNGATRYLEIGVRTNGGGAFSLLAPRQQITSTPYSITAGNLNGTLPASQLSGTVPLAQLPSALITNNASGVNLSGAFGGNGAGLTGLNLAANSGGAITLGSAGGFGAGSTYTVGSQPFWMVAADVFGRGRLDLVTANWAGGPGNTLSILTNNGSGGFAPASNLNVSSGVYGLAAADVNADNKVDLICANYGNGSGSTVAVFTNNGSGGFVLSSNYTVGPGPTAVIAADVNGDGKPDLITANFGGSTLTILTNNGSGGFVLSSSPTVGNGPVTVVAADVNNDGKLDLIAANLGPGYSGNTLTILTNNGSGSFGFFTNLMVGNGPYGLAAADVNGDGYVDLISANVKDGTLSVLTNDGTGHFTLSATLTVGSGPAAVAAADVNGDGKLDLISANWGSGSGNTLTVLTNNGNGGFVLASSPAVGTGPAALVAVDLNGDGKPDLASANAGGGTVTVLLNTSSGAVFSGAFSGNGAGLTSLNPANLSAGTAAISISGNAATATTATGFSGALAGDVTGTQGATVVTPNIPRLTLANTFTGTNIFGGIIATNAHNVFTIENRTNDPPSPAVGQIWLRTDL